MNAAELMDVISGVVGQFSASGLPVGITAEDLSHECFLATVGIADRPVEFVAQAARNKVRMELRGSRRGKVNINQFIASCTQELRRKGYHSPNTLTDPWALLDIAAQKDAYKRWRTTREHSMEQLEAHVRRCKIALSQSPIGEGYAHVL